MRNSYSTICMLVFAVLVAGCASKSPIRLEIDSVQSENTSVPYGTIPAASPEHAHNALLANYQEDSNQGFINSIRHANSIQAKWPQHPYAASSAYLAGWASLWVDTQPAAEPALAGHRHWSAYIGALTTASAYFERAGEYDHQSDSFWTTVSAAPLAFIHEGFREPGALAQLLSAQRLLKITYLNARDFETLKQAVIELEAIQSEFPEWSRRYGVDTLIQRTLVAMGVEAERRERAEEIFGG